MPSDLAKAIAANVIKRIVAEQGLMPDNSIQSRIKAFELIAAAVDETLAAPKIPEIQL